MKDVNVYCYFHYSLLKKIQYVGYEITENIYTSYGDCTIWCKPYTHKFRTFMGSNGYVGVYTCVETK